MNQNGGKYRDLRKVLNINEKKILQKQKQS